MAALYAWGWGTRGDRAPSAWSPLASGRLALLAALNGPLHDLSDWYLFSAHMVQHLILTLVVPPLLLTGTPAWMADALLRPCSRVGLPPPWSAPSRGRCRPSPPTRWR